MAVKRSVEDATADDGGGSATKRQRQSAQDDARREASRAETTKDSSAELAQLYRASCERIAALEAEVEGLRAENTRLRCKRAHDDARSWCVCAFRVLQSRESPPRTDDLFAPSNDQMRASTRNQLLEQASHPASVNWSSTHTRAGSTAAKSAVERFVIEPCLERQWSNPDAILRPRARRVAKGCECGSSRQTEKHRSSQTARRSVHCDALALDQRVQDDSADRPHRAKQGAHAAVRVLADPWLWQCIIDCVTGLPYAVLEFERNTKRSFSEKRMDDETSSMHDDGKGVWSPAATTESSLPELAIAEDNRTILRSIYALRRFAYYRSHRKLTFNHVVRCAIWYKRWEILQWLGRVLPRDPMWSCESDVMTYAMEQRDLTLMSWVYHTFPDACLPLSARRIEVRESGNLALVKWLHEHDYAFSAWMMNGAAARGNLDVVRFLHDRRTEGCTTLAMDLAARFGHLDVVQFLHANRTEGCTEQALDGAAKYGRRDVVQFLLKSRSEGRAVSALKTAMIYNQHEIMRILQESLTVWGHQRSIHAE